MSAPRPLPVHPDLHQLKTQAKELLRAHQSGNAEVVPRLRAHVPALAGANDDEVLAARFALLDAQAVLAREYGFDTWDVLAAHVASAAVDSEVDFDDFLQLSHRDAYVIVFKLDPHDLAIALASMTDPQRQLFLHDMPEAMRAAIEADVAATQVDETATRVARERLVAAVAALAEQGQLEWPKTGSRKPRQGECDAARQLAERLQRTSQPRLTDMTCTDIDHLMADLRQLARIDGIEVLRALLDGIQDPFLHSALQMALDGTEPDRVSVALENWMHSLLHEQEIRLRKVIAGIRGVQLGDNPVYMRATLGLIY